MRNALRRETTKFGRDFVGCWTRSSGKFKTISVWFAVYLALIVATEIAWKVFTGHSTASSAGVVLLIISMQFAKFLGKKHLWL